MSKCCTMAVSLGGHRFLLYTPNHWPHHVTESNNYPLLCTWDNKHPLMANVTLFDHPFHRLYGHLCSFSCCSIVRIQNLAQLCLLVVLCYLRFDYSFLDIHFVITSLPDFYLFCSYTWFEVANCPVKSLVLN